MPEVSSVPAHAQASAQQVSGNRDFRPTLSNILIAWNTTHIQQARANIKASSGQLIATEHPRQIAPTDIEGINLRGTSNFPAALYAKRILPSIVAGNPHFVNQSERLTTG